MATAKKATSKKPSTKQHGTWSQGNLPAPGKIRYTDAMKAELFDRIAKADKAGTPRTDVFKALAKKWSKGKNKYTSHQVSSKFHESKKAFGYDVVRQAQPGKAKAEQAPTATATKPASTSTSKAAAKAKPVAKDRPDVILSNITVDLPKAVAAMREQLEDARTSAKVNAARADAAEKALARISKVLSA